VRDAWASYDTYTDVAHQLCCAHAMRELQAVADTAPPNTQWCWADQAADALVAMQRLVAEATAGGDTVDADALATEVHHYRSATQVAITDTAARSDTVMKEHNAPARRLIDRQDDYLRFTQDRRIPADNNGSERDIRMIKLRQKYPAACAPSPEPNNSARYAATSPPPPSTASNSSTPSSCSPRGAPGCPQQTDVTSYDCFVF
jgi:hypothetical protein